MLTVMPALLDRRFVGLSRESIGPEGGLSVNLLRHLFRALLMFRAAHEDFGLDTVTGPGGEVWSIWDIEALYEASQNLLPPRQSQAIRFFLVEGMYEADAAERMGVSRSNPIGMYATDGLSRIVSLVEDRCIRGYQNDGRGQ
jgi:hypothetical protein